MCIRNASRRALTEVRRCVTHTINPRQEIHGDLPPSALLSRKRLSQWGLNSYGLRLGSLCLCLVAVTRYGISQSTSASVNGTVRDQSGAVVSGVHIVLANVDTGVQRTAATGSAGVYFLGDIPPGSYSAQASNDRFATEKRNGIVLQVNQTATLDFTLAVGPQKETVTVVSNLSVVDSTTSELGTVITTGFVANLPLNGRNFTQLLELTPGVSPVSVAQNSTGGNGFGGLPIGAFSFSRSERAAKQKQHVSAGRRQRLGVSRELQLCSHHR